MRVSASQLGRLRNIGAKRPAAGQPWHSGNFRVSARRACDAARSDLQGIAPRTFSQSKLYSQRKGRQAIYGFREAVVRWALVGAELSGCGAVINRSWEIHRSFPAALTATLRARTAAGCSPILEAIRKCGPFMI